MEDSGEKLIIRKEQMQAFREVAIKDFEDRTVVHLEKSFPEKSQELGESGVREAIRHGIKRAAIYKIKSKYGVEKYIEVMFMFGSDFDRDANLPWARRILSDRTLKGSKAKADHLYETAMKNVDRADIGGERGA